MDEGSLATVDLGIEGLDDAVEIGRGGFGSVYKAHQRNLARTVAVKMLRDAVTDERVRLRFERECWAMGTLAGHPNIITVHGSGFTERGQPYIVMDFMPSGALADRMESGGPLPWAEVLSIGVKVAGALETAHRSGVLHRDIKPENILVSNYGEPQLADFGIARLQGSEETKTDTLTASIAHVSPELLAGERPSALSDVYALGSTLFMLLANEAAFIRATDQSIVPALTRITSDPVPDLRPHGVPAALCEVIEAMMAKDPAVRIQTAEAAGRALQECQRALRQHVTPLTIVGEPSIPQLDSSATNTINAGALGALPPLPTAEEIPVPVVAAAQHAAGAATGVVGPPAAPTAGPAALGAAVAPPATPVVVPGAPSSGGTRKRAPLVVAVIAVVAVAAGGGAFALLSGGSEPPAVVGGVVTDPTADPEASEGGAPAAGVDRAALLASRLEPADLAGSEWTIDSELASRMRSTVPEFLCTRPDIGATPTEVVAYRGGTPGPRIGHALWVLPEGQAEAFMAALFDEVSCFEQQGGTSDVVAEPIGDDGLRISYVNAGSTLTQQTDLYFLRVGDVVSEVAYLGYPATDPSLRRQIIETVQTKTAVLGSG